MNQLRIPNARATLMLIAFLVVSGLTQGVYAASGVVASPIAGWLSVLGWTYVIWNWIHADCKRLGINEPLDLGFFVIVGWPVVYLYHLIKTRGWGRGLLMVAAMIGLLVGWYLFSIAVGLTAKLIILMANLRPGSGF